MSSIDPEYRKHPNIHAIGTINSVFKELRANDIVYSVDGSAIKGGSFRRGNERPRKDPVSSITNGMHRTLRNVTKKLGQMLDKDKLPEEISDEIANLEEMLSNYRSTVKKLAEEIKEELPSGKYPPFSSLEDLYELATANDIDCGECRQRIDELNASTLAAYNALESFIESESGRDDKIDIPLKIKGGGAEYAYTIKGGDKYALRYLVLLDLVKHGLFDSTKMPESVGERLNEGIMIGGAAIWQNAKVYILDSLKDDGSPGAQQVLDAFDETIKTDIASVKRVFTKNVQLVSSMLNPDKKLLIGKELTLMSYLVKDVLGITLPAVAASSIGGGESSLQR